MAAPQTLPDLLRDGLDIAFVGINPSLFSVQQGHYFARRANRFWPCFSRSTLSAEARRALGVAQLMPEHDRALLDHGFGFTDAAKRPTARAAELSAQELAAGVRRLLTKLKRHAPRIACFHGMTGYRPFQRVIAPQTAHAVLGLQDSAIGPTRLFVVPNPSPANAHFTPAEQVAWYDRLAAALAEIRSQDRFAP